jgi:hypothetical protein
MPQFKPGLPNTTMLFVLDDLKRLVIALGQRSYIIVTVTAHYHLQTTRKTIHKPVNDKQLPERQAASSQSWLLNVQIHNGTYVTGLGKSTVCIIILQVTQLAPIQHTGS